MSDSFELAMLRQDCEPYDCPRCGSPAGQPCINPRTGDPLRIPCQPRVRAAEAAALAAAMADTEGTTE